MSKYKISTIKSVVSEYGLKWLICRTLYIIKLQLLRICPFIEVIFEKRVSYPKRLDLFEINITELRTFLSGLSIKDKRLLVKTADDACKGIINGFSSTLLDFGNPIDWQLNPLSGERCDERIKWYKIPDFDKRRGDIKIIWEASRFSHFLLFARAFLVTNDTKYYNSFNKQLKWWLDSNKYGYGANYKCGQECSLRLINCLLAYTVFEGCGLTTIEDERNVKELIYRCYRKILSNFFYAYRCIKNNHTISELMGMIAGAWSVLDYRQLRKAFHMLEGVIERQFTDDGGYCQYSFNYQRLALQDIECLISIGRRIKYELPDSCKIRVLNSAFLLYQCQDESWDVPNYGSNDGSLVFSLSSCSYRDFRPVINTIYSLIDGTQLYEDGKHQEELIWWSGGKPVNEYRKQFIERTPSQFRKAGLFTFRTNTSWAMVVSNDYLARPSHMDQLHIDLWVSGINVLCDSGSYSYADNLGKVLCSCESHNTLVVPGLSQMKTIEPFLTYDWTKRELGTYDYNSFESKCISMNRYEHIRKIHVKNEVYEIEDIVDKNAEIRFHTPCDVVANSEGLELVQQGKVLCSFRSSEPFSIQKSVSSLYYLKAKEINVIIIKCVSNKPVITRITIV